MAVYTPNPSGAIPILRTLFEVGADPFLKTAQGRGLSDIATEAGKGPEVLSLIDAHVAMKNSKAKMKEEWPEGMKCLNKQFKDMQSEMAEAVKTDDAPFEKFMKKAFKAAERCGLL